MRTAWEAVPDGIRLHLRVTPRGGRDAIDGIRETGDGRCHLAVRVSTPPEDGAANEAVRRLIARSAGVSRSAVRIESGLQSREKRVIIQCGIREIDSWLDNMGVKA